MDRGEDPHGMEALLLQYLEWMDLKGYTEATLRTTSYNHRLLAVWLEQRGVTQPREVTRPMLERYHRYLRNYRKSNGDPLSPAWISGRLTMIRWFFRWLTKNNFLLSNPAADLEIPRQDKRLPRAVLNVSQVEEVLRQPNLEDPFGIRDRAILETFYATGIRRLELINLHIQDVDMERGTVMIRLGKGRKDRMVPIGERAVAWIDKYLLEARPQLALEPDGGTLFLSAEGRRLSKSRMTDIVGGYLRKAGIPHGSCHVFRHAMATQMLEGGADVRYIQHMLGHASLTTTEVYTLVSIRKLKEVYERSHPAALLRKPAPDEPPRDPLFNEDSEEEEFFPLAADEDPDEEDGNEEQ